VSVNSGEVQCPAYINNDDYIDIIASSSTNDSICVFLGLGDGQFAAPYAIYDYGANDKLTVADVNRDGNVDIFSVGQSSGFKELINNGDGTFSPGFSLDPFTYHPVNLAIGFVNNDNLLDWATVLSGSIPGPNITTYLNDGFGDILTGSNVLYSFSLITSLCSIDLADLDSDGDNDIISGTGTRNPYYYILWNNGSGSFNIRDTISIPYDDPIIIMADDVDLDGDNDILSLCDDSKKIYIKYNNGTGGFNSDYAINYNFISNAFLLDDLDYDSDLDIAISNNEDSSLVFYKNNGSGEYTSSISRSLNGISTSIEYADVDNDTDLDIIYITDNSDSIYVLFNMCKFVCGDVNHDYIINLLDILALIDYVQYHLDSPIPLESGDVNADRKLPLAVYMLKVELSGGTESGGLNETIAIQRDPDRWYFKGGRFRSSGDGALPEVWH